MKITVTVTIPDEEMCDGCDFWYRGENRKCYCILFGLVELVQKFKENMVTGTYVLKCDECKNSKEVL